MSVFVDYTGKERKIASQTGRAAGDVDEIPVIDLAPFLNGKDKASVVAAVKHAAENVGFMYLSGHGLTTSVMDQAFGEAKVFFDQPEEAKRELLYSLSPVFRGYEPSKGNVQGDLKEAFNFGYEPAADPLNPSNELVEDATAGSGPNVWPSDDSPASGLRDAILAYYGEVLVLGRQIIRLFALALDLPESIFDEAFSVPGVLGRILHYPPQPAMEESALQVGVNQHTDIECFTLLLQGPDLTCLEVLNRNGEWLEAPPIPGTLVCNIGDMLSRWTNDRFVSTAHRVINKTGKQRYSMPVFFGPNYNTLITPFEQCLAGEASKYPPIKAGEYVWRRLARSRLGVKYDESVKLEEAVAVTAVA
ncbi:hypothetical protein JCM8547_007320 [Rhodosporidiobolus lusitaniae]